MKVNKSIGKKIGILSRSQQIYFSNNLKKYSIGHSQITTLHYISHHDGLTQYELIKHLQLNKSSVTTQLNNLEKNGYITRKIYKSDKRERKIFITEKTKQIKDSLHEVFTSWSNILTKGFTETERELSYKLLNKMIDNTKNEISKIKLDEEKK